MKYLLFKKKKKNIYFLRSEMKNPKYKFTFGLIIEAYCRGLGSTLKILLQQNEAVERLSHLAQKIKSDSDNINLIKVITDSHAR